MLKTLHCMVSELYAGLPTVPSISVLMSLAIVVTHYTVNVNGMLAAVVSNEPRNLKDFILRPNQNLCQTVRLLTEGDDTRGCGDTIGPPDDEQRAARNMLRSVM